MSEDIQEIRARIDILDLASELTKLTRRGRKYIGRCPFHDEKTPSFSIEPNLGLYHCFGCGVGGDAIELFMRSQGLEFRAAIRVLADRYGLSHQSAPREPALDALRAAQRYFERHLKSEIPCRYLHERQISGDLGKRFGVGYAPPSFNKLSEVLLAGGFRLEELLEVGLVGRADQGAIYDRFKDRLTVAIYSPAGELCGFAGRTLIGHRAKYVNSAESRWFKKGALLWGLQQARRSLRSSRCAVLVEGYFDVMGCAAVGVETAVASMGTALTEHQAKLLRRHADEVVIAYDGDEAGQRATTAAIPILLAEGLHVRVAKLEQGQDPDSLRKEEPARLRDLIANAPDAVSAAIRAAATRPPNDLVDPTTAAVGAAVEAMIAASSPALQQTYRRQLEAHLGRQVGKTTRREAHATIATAPDEWRIVAGLVAGTLALESQLPSEAFVDPLARRAYSAWAILRHACPTPDAVIKELEERQQAEAGVVLLADPASDPREVVALRERHRIHELERVQLECSRAVAAKDTGALREALEARRQLMAADEGGE